MFRNLKNAIQKQYDAISEGQPFLFYKNVDRDKIWETYLESYPPEERQEHNCNSCKSFLRQWSGIVAIRGLRVHSIWDFHIESVDIQYRDSVVNLKAYISSLPITDVFLTETKKAGNARNLDSVRKVYWEHMSLSLDNVKVVNINDIPSKQSEYRSSKEVFKRALEELTIDSMETVLDLIAQNSLYRGAEFKGIIDGFLKVKKVYQELPDSQKDAFAWSKSLERGIPTGIRNSAIGTLLVNLSEGMDLDTAVRKYEAVVAPTNYKRPTALITPRMIEEAKAKLSEMGFLDSLDRRFANPSDVNVHDLLFVDRSSEITDIFGDLAKDTLVNPKTLSKIEEIHISKFIGDVIPTAKSIEVLLEQKHFNNFVSLITTENLGSRSMFKWPNPFSWDYSGGTADSIKERVKAAGGNVDGVLRFSIQWNDEDTKAIVDFDAHALEPSGNHIYYSGGYRKDRGNLRTGMSGQLDVDMINPPGVGVENITWTDLSKMKDGIYTFTIHNYNGRMTTGFKAQIEFNGEIYDFHYSKHVNGYMDVAKVDLTKGVFTLHSSFQSSSSAISSKEKWGVKTSIFTKVKSIMLSPNHWDIPPTGNKHYMFMLEGAVNDEQARPFYNEFLRQDLNDNRKVLDVMASKLKIPYTTNQLSGIGFSETQSNSLIVRVTSSFKRNIKINF